MIFSISVSLQSVNKVYYIKICMVLYGKFEYYLYFLYLNKEEFLLI